MTWSIVAFEAESSLMGAIVATHAVAVGGRCLFGQPGVAVGTTQAMTNRYLGRDILTEISNGTNIVEAMNLALNADNGSDFRQLNVVNTIGEIASWTGCNSFISKGEAIGSSVRVVGNTLASDAVLTDTLSAWQDSTEPFAERLVSAMSAGFSAGGDLRGTQSAALLVMGKEDFPVIDLRIDDDQKPLTALQNLLAKWRASVEPSLARIPNKSNRHGIVDINFWKEYWRAKGQIHLFPH